MFLADVGDDDDCDMMVMTMMLMIAAVMMLRLLGMMNCHVHDIADADC